MEALSLRYWTSDYQIRDQHIYLAVYKSTRPYNKTLDKGMVNGGLITLLRAITGCTEYLDV